MYVTADRDQQNQTIFASLLLDKVEEKLDMLFLGLVVQDVLQLDRKFIKLDRKYKRQTKCRKAGKKSLQLDVFNKYWTKNTKVRQNWIESIKVEQKV